MNDRHTWADTAKAIGMILVVYGHTARGLQSAGLGIHHETFMLIDSVLYSFHMPLFFLISGFFLPDSLEKRGSTAFVFSKIDNIVYPYVLWSLIQGLIEVFLSKYTNGAISFKDILNLAWMPRAQFWFLYALFQIFLLIALFYAILKKKAYPLLTFSALALYIYQLVIPSPFAYVAQNMIFLMIGIIMSSTGKWLIKSNQLILMLLGVAFVFSQYYFHAILGFTYKDKGMASLALAFISILFVIHAAAAITGSLERVLCYIGAASMSIYILHILFTSGTRIVMSRVLHNHNPIAHTMAGVAVGLGAPLLIHALIEKHKVKYVFSAPISRRIWPHARQAMAK